MDLNAAHMFVTVVNKGSFSAAATSLNIPVATISRRVSELEKTLGVRLLERTTRKQRLTETGETLYEHASRGVQEFEAGLLALEEKQTELKGVLRISMPPNFEPMGQLIKRFQYAYNLIEIEILVTERRVDFIEDGIDIALRVGDLQSQSAIARKLTEYRHILVASQAYLNKHSITKIEDLHSAKCLAWGKVGQAVTWSLGGQKIKITPKLKLNDYVHIRNAILDGEGISEIPPFLCEKYIHSKKLIEVLPEYPFPLYSINLMYPRRIHISRIARVFIDYCINNFNNKL